MKHAKKIAKRIAELGGVQTADPTEFVMLSPLKRFSMPRSNSDVNEILSYPEARTIHHQDIWQFPQ